MSKTNVAILVAEDEKPIAHALQLKLQSQGFSVDVAQDGEEALQKVQASAYDLLILDLIMPKKNGFEVLEALQKQSKKPKVIVASNLSQEQDEQRARALGASDYFVKSNATLVDIIDRVKKILEV